MDLRRFKSKPKTKIPPLEKRIRPNPKYENIKPTIDTGNNTRKHLEKMEEMKTYYKFRPDEIFRRVTVTSLVTLMLEQSKLEYQEDDSEKLNDQIREDHESLQGHLIQEPEEQQEQPQEEIIEEEASEEVVPPQEEEAEAAVEDCEADSLDSAIDPEEQRAAVVADDDDDYIESVVFKGKKIKKSSGPLSHHFSSVGNLLQGIGEMNMSPRSINDMSDKAYHHNDSTKAASTFQLDAPPPDPPAPVAHHHHHLYDGEINEDQKPMLKKRDRPYLILDIRDQDHYKQGRIVTSKSFPAPRLARSVNWETKDLVRLKNVPGKLIVVADSDESKAANFATILVQRGYDNVFVLSGGLRVAKIKFPEQLITPCNFDVDDQDDFDEQMEEDQIHVIEAFLEEALASGTSRLSSMAPSRGSGWPSRISSSQSNLPSMVDSTQRHKPRQVPLGVNYYPPRPQRTSFNSRRS